MGQVIGYGLRMNGSDLIKEICVFISHFNYDNIKKCKYLIILLVILVNRYGKNNDAPKPDLSFSKSGYETLEHKNSFVSIITKS